MNLKTWAAPLALLMAFALLLVPANAQAGVLGGTIELYDNGVDVENATTDYKFIVSVPDYFSLDQDYWNFTVYGFLVNNTGAAADTTFVAYVYINDGTTNVTANSGNIVMDNDTTSHVYGNISIAAASFASLTEVDNATLYVVLKVGATVKDSYVGEAVISDTYMGGIIAWIVPMMVTLFAFGVIFAGFSKIMSSASKIGKKKR